MSSDSNDKTPIRKRGIRASRLKLQKAMAQAGIKTQTALAEKIADQENLETIPKDFVSRVFREKRVEPHSLERIASILQVDAYTLYATDEAAQTTIVKPPADTTTPAVTPAIEAAKPLHSQPFNRKGLLAVTALCILAIIVYAYSQTAQNAASQPEPPANTALKQPALGKYSLLLRYNNQLESLAASLITKMASHYQLSVPDNAVTKNEHTLPAAQLAKTYQPDFVLMLNSQQFDDFLLVEATLYYQGALYEIWSRSIRKSLAEHAPNLLWQDFVLQLQGITDGTLDVASLDIFPRTAQRYYLEGRELLDKGADDLNIKSAQSRFMNAINLAPNHALAHAALCQARVSESWMGDEKQLLEEAQQACSTARQLQPDNHYVLASIAYLYRRSGRVSEAINLLNDYMATHPATSDMLISLANAQLEEYREHPEQPELLDSIRSNLRLATTISPGMWVAFLTLGHIELMANDVPSAINAMEKANHINPNEILISNLGTLNFCLGNIEVARNYYQQAITRFPDSHLGTEMLGMVEHAAAHYDTAISLRLQGLQNAGQANIHHMWGALADSYYMQGDMNAAASMYQKSLGILEKDKLRGNYTTSDKVMTLFYLTRLAQSAPDMFTLPDNANSRLNELSKNAAGLESPALIRIALLHKIYGNQKQYHRFFEIMVERCPVYADLPEFSY